ncbi:hypothetical protein [Pseudoroseomonas ludipueritiae]|uniref:Uncharacterized protein n=1 Tax=Pseudoroseomonas ludipueritiae TaxID=198093 RepID=A0ABR7R1S6_9PROT|nr:hypothetical protein [Pseudoroseomonas ludipueritiae]MBC9175652.1 hypothetical protein [Pseudoroseomonas ludipueritiae]MCG7359751.1 hypothetical protein [Roseomonas sp. ACRSG]
MEQINTFTLLVAREELENLRLQAAALIRHPDAGPTILLLNHIEAALDEADRLADMLGSKIAPMPWWQAFGPNSKGAGRR